MKRILQLSLVFLLFLAFEGRAQDKTIVGTVTSSEDGGPLPGVTVSAKSNQAIGTVTNADGQYALTIPQDITTLTFSYIGMTSQDVSVGNQTSINVVLQPDVKQLSEVVVTALGIERQTKSLGYSTQKVSGEAIARSGETNMVQGLAGKAAGVQIVGSGGTPGASSKILIRGNRSFTGENQPLFVIDGVPMSNETDNSEGSDYPFNANLQGVNQSNRAIDINPEDIASVTVLKGPAAAALYGVRAGNGAIIITTKRGNRGAIVATVSSNVSFDRVNKLPEFQKTYAQGTGGGNQRMADGTIRTPTYITNGLNGSAGTAQSWGPRISDIGLQSHDNVENFFKTGVTVTNNVSVSGGNEKSSVRLSLGHLDQSGIVPNTDFKRYSVRLTGESELTKRLSVSATINYIQSGGTRAQNGSNLAGVALSLFRTPESYNIKENYRNPDGSFNNYFAAYDNPYWSVHENPFTDDNKRILGNFSFKYKLTDWLNITYRAGGDTYSDHRKQIFSVYSQQPAGIGEVFEDVVEYQELYQDVLATASKTYDKIGLSLTVGQNLNSIVSGNSFGRARNLAIPGFYNLANGSDRYSDQSTLKRRHAAVFFDLNASYNDLLFIGVTGRNEWASTFGTAKNNFFYPSVNAALVFSELLPENEIMSFGKVRVAYAQSGNAPLAYRTNTYYTQPFFTDGFTNGLSFPYLGQQGFGTSTRLGNDNLKPEQTASFEVGADVRFFNSRLNVDFTYYFAKSSDLILNRPIASSTGYQEFVDNAGAMENRGIELVVSADVIKTNAFTFNSSLNFTRNRNEVTKLAPGVEEISIESAFTGIGSFAIVGEPYGVFYGTRWRRNEDGDVVINPATGRPFVDATEGNVGNPNPDWLAGWRNTFTYKGFTLTGLLDVRKGGDLWAGTIARLNNIGRTEKSGDRERDFVIPGVIENADGTFRENDIAIPAYNYWQSYWGDGPGGAVEQQIQDGGWIRLREVALSYSLKNLNLLKTISSLNFTVTGRNLFLITDYEGVDPETSLTGAGSNIGGFDYFNNPSTKSFSFGISADLK